jgi:hypothetical protein
LKPCQKIALIERQELLYLCRRLRRKVTREHGDLLFQRANV